MLCRHGVVVVGDAAGMFASGYTRSRWFCRLLAVILPRRVS